MIDFSLVRDVDLKSNSFVELYLLRAISIFGLIERGMLFNAPSFPCFVI